jgi:formylmethanofuran dehydrogenase subunit E
MIQDRPKYELIELPPNTKPPQEQVDYLVEAAARAHGHLCPGQVIGVRMSILGLSLLGYDCPLGYPEIKNLMGFVEIERCLADSVASSTGLRFGRGSLKLVDLGLLAVTFLDMPSDRAVRLLSRDDARDKAADYAPGQANPHATQTEAYRVMPDSELFDVTWVKVDRGRFLAPGQRPPKVPCTSCGVLVRSGQARTGPNGPLCAVCAADAYFTPTHPEES